jgi:hypothetical protein
VPDIAAILHNKMRGSGREVKLAFSEVGIEIWAQGDTPLAVWPYTAILLAAPLENDEMVALRLPHDDVLALHLFGREHIARVINSSPGLRKARWGQRYEWAYRVMIGVPDPARAVVFVLPIVGVMWLIMWLRG